MENCPKKKQNGGEKPTLAEKAPVPVIVSNIAGEEVITFHTTSEETGLGLRRKVAERMNASVDTVRLVLEGEAVGDVWVVPESYETVKLLFISVVMPRHIQPLALDSDNFWNKSAEAWDDGDFLRTLFSERSDAELASVTLTQNEGCVKGIHCTYRTAAGEVNAPRHDCPSSGFYADNWPDVPPATLVLEEGERINRVTARTGEVLDRLEIFTDRGQSVAVGGNGGSFREVDFEEGSYVIGFSGHENSGVLVRLGFYLL